MRRWLWAVLILVIAGCGYTTGSLLPSKYKTIFVTPFKNSVGFQSHNIDYVPQLEVKVRDAVVNRFLFEGHLRIGQEETSDLVLRGELKGFERQELRVTENEDVQEFRINIIADLELWDPVDQKVVWSEPNFAGEATYFVTGPQAKSETAAIDEAISDFAKRAVERVLEDW
jgi:hypothetical protein